MFTRKEICRRYYLKKRNEILKRGKRYRDNNIEKEHLRGKKYRLLNIEKTKKRIKLWRLKNKERVKITNKLWHNRTYISHPKKKVDKTSPEWKAQHKIRRSIVSKKYYRSNKKKICEYHRVRRNYNRKNNPRLRLDYNMSTHVWLVLKNKKNKRSWNELVGYSVDELIKHLENQFSPKMNWNNYGPYWHVDHIKPKSLFKYDSPDDMEFKKCWALKNLQPLEKFLNLSKNNRYIG